MAGPGRGSLGAASALLFPPQARRQHVAATGVAGRAVRGWGGARAAAVAERGPRGGEGAAVAAGEQQLQPLCPAERLAATLRPWNSARPLPREGAGRTERPGALARPCPLAGALALGLPLGRNSVSALTGLDHVLRETSLFL